MHVPDLVTGTDDSWRRQRDREVTWKLNPKTAQNFSKKASPVDRGGMFKERGRGRESIPFLGANAFLTVSAGQRRKWQKSNGKSRESPKKRPKSATPEKGLFRARPSQVRIYCQERLWVSIKRGGGEPPGGEGDENHCLDTQERLRGNRKAQNLSSQATAENITTGGKTSSESKKRETMRKRA